MTALDPIDRPTSRRRRCAASTVTSLLLTTSILGGCEQPAAEPDAPTAGTTSNATEPATQPATTTPSDAPASTNRRGYEIPIPQLEYWAGTETLKYSYEMRFDPPDEEGGRPRLHRNGWARAFYLTGELEREGVYRYVAANGRSERVGRWTYYTPEGTVDRTEERGGEVIWTGPDQLIAPPEAKPATP
jgi:hypothetical protein